MPEATSSRIIAPERTYVAAGSPGPFEKTTPSGFSARISAAVASPFSTVERAPALARLRRMFFFTPKSTTTVWNSALPIA